MGYLIPVLREKFKDSKIIALHADSSFREQCGYTEKVSALHCAQDSNVQDFLEKEIPDTDTSRIRIIEWRPSLNYYREAYVKLLSQAVEFIKRADAGKRTVSAFGRRWVKNFFRNLGIIEQTLLCKTADIPVIITGSGPGLEKALPAIRETREQTLLIASSSSTMALANGGITPDIVIAADGGAWALRHFYPYFRTGGSSALAANLCAALPSQCALMPVLIINDGSFWQSIALHELSLPSVMISQKGTVTAAAVELALQLSGGNIYLAGMDLSARDIRTHARPYSFDHLFFEKACRFTPVYSQGFTRSRLLKEGGSLDIYTAWFKNALLSWPKRIFSLTDSSAAFEKARSISGAQSAAHYANVKKSVCFKTSVSDSRFFPKRAGEALCAALKNREYASGLKKELSAMLFPQEKDAAYSELEKEILAISGRTSRLKEEAVNE